MAERDVQFRRVTFADIDALIRLQADYYREDGYVHHEGKARGAWQTLLSDGNLGSVWVADSAAGLVGYVVVTLGYSLEYLGKDAFIDEIYLTPSVRGQGWGREALSLAEAACVRAGAETLHLEVERNKIGVRELYRRSGFVASERVLMTKPLKRAALEPPPASTTG